MKDEQIEYHIASNSWEMIFQNLLILSKLFIRFFQLMVVSKKPGKLAFCLEIANHYGI